jgi:hypothetical protein
MSFIPLAERGSVDLNDSVLNKGVRSDKLVVGGIVDLVYSVQDRTCYAVNDHTHDTDNPRLFCNVLRSPCIVSRFQAESPVLKVSATDTDCMNPLSAELGTCGLTAELELSLLAIVGALCAGF